MSHSIDALAVPKGHEHTALADTYLTPPLCSTPRRRSPHVLTMLCAVLTRRRGWPKQHQQHTGSDSHHSTAYIDVLTQKHTYLYISAFS